MKDIWQDTIVRNRPLSTVIHKKNSGRGSGFMRIRGYEKEQHGNEKEQRGNEKEQRGNNKEQRGYN